MGRRNVHLGWGTTLVGRRRRRCRVVGTTFGALVSSSLLALTWLTALAWAFAPALIDGWHRRFTSRFTGPDEYLHELRRFGNIPAALRHFARRAPDWWNTQVSGHPWSRSGRKLASIG